jgi:exopolysaccharide biosynthesis polyprenyl glycosylphosphotransferase
MNALGSTSAEAPTPTPTNARRGALRHARHRRSRSPSWRRMPMVAGDVLALAIAALSVVITHDESPPAWVLLLAGLVALASNAQHKLYQWRLIETHRTEIGRLFSSSSTAGLIVMSSSLLADQLTKSLVTFASISFVTQAGTRELQRALYGRWRRSGQLSTRLVLLDTGPLAASAAHQIERRTGQGFEIVDSLQLDLVSNIDLEIDRIVACARSAHASGVLLAPAEIQRPHVSELLRQLAWAGLFVEAAVGLEGIAPGRTTNRIMGGSVMMVIDPIKTRGLRPLFKRIFDVSVAAGLLAIALVPMMIISLAVKVDSRGPIIYRALRYGRYGRTFTCLKFRTMIDAPARSLEDEGLPLVHEMQRKVRSDPRITRLGKVLRSTSLDELPQLINILWGDMSLVGPRPLPLNDALVDTWATHLPYRHLVRPGLTCAWQVNGRSNLSDDERLALDLYYVDNWTLWRDLMILGKTVPAVLRRQGAF